MASTNKTTNYELSQFIGSDKPAWLSDYNGDMSKIDTSIKSVSDKADTAQDTAETAQSSAETAQSTATTAQENATSAVSTAQNAVQTASTASETANTASSNASQALETANGLADTVATAQSTAETAQSKAETAQSKAETAQTTANTAQNKATAAQTTADNAISGLSKFNLTVHTSKTTNTSFIPSVTFDSTNLRFSQSSDGSIFKFYGRLVSHRTSGSGSLVPTSTNVPMGTTSGQYTGYDTGFVLKKAPAGAYQIEGGMLTAYKNADSGGVFDTIVERPFVVGANGHIYIGERVYYDQHPVIDYIPPCLYFNIDFGD